MITAKDWLAVAALVHRFLLIVLEALGGARTSTQRAANGRHGGHDESYSVEPMFNGKVQHGGDGPIKFAALLGQIANLPPRPDPPLLTMVGCLLPRTSLISSLKLICFFIFTFLRTPLIQFMLQTTSSGVLSSRDASGLRTLDIFPGRRRALSMGLKTKNVVDFLTM